MTSGRTGSDPDIHQDPHFLRAALHALGDGISLADRDGHIFYSNRAADRILGVSGTDAPPEEWADHYGAFLPDGETPFPVDEYPLVRAIRGEETDNVEMLIRNEAVPRGRLISVTGRPVRDAGGEILGAAVVFRDITDLRRTEKELRAALRKLEESREQREELTAFLVHDMKSPLTAVLSNCDFVLDSSSLDDADREALTDLRYSAETLHRMILDLLDVQAAKDGRLEPHPTPVDPVELLEEVADTARQMKRGVTLHVERPTGPPIPPVLADREILRRILVNLVDNCLKYGPPDGRIWLEASAPDEEIVRFRVSDEGPGVPPDLRETIFERYATVERDRASNNPGSRGLGLRFCRVAVEAHGGRIWVEDNEPRGARFCVELPRGTTPEGEG